MSADQCLSLSSQRDHPSRLFPLDLLPQALCHIPGVHLLSPITSMRLNCPQRVPASCQHLSCPCSPWHSSCVCHCTRIYRSVTAGAGAGHWGAHREWPGTDTGTARTDRHGNGLDRQTREWPRMDRQTWEWPGQTDTGTARDRQTREWPGQTDTGTARHVLQDIPHPLWTIHSGLGTAQGGN